MFSSWLRVEYLWLMIYQAGYILYNKNDHEPSGSLSEDELKFGKVGYPGLFIG